MNTDNTKDKFISIEYLIDIEDRVIILEMIMSHIIYGFKRFPTEEEMKAIRVAAMGVLQKKYPKLNVAEILLKDETSKYNTKN